MRYPILFSIIGAITGLIISQTAIHSDSSGMGYFLFAHVLLVAVFSFIWKKQPTLTIIKSLVVMAIILFGLTAWYVWNDYQSVRRFSLLLPVALIQITVICTSFIQSWKPSKPHFTYTNLFENAWNNHFFLIFSALLTGGFLAVLGLGTALFDNIGIEISDLIWSKELTPIIVATLVGAGIGISREYDSLIFKIRGVFFAIFRVMAYLAAAIVILFVISLPFTVDTLFQNRNTSLILLSLVAISILLLNTLVDTSEASDESTLPVWRNRIFSVQIVLLPILSLLSVYAISIRIMQYGLMPKRVVAIAIAALLSIYSLVYLYQLITRKGNWVNGLARINPPLAGLWVAMLIVLASPLIDPVRLSVNSQVARLQSNHISPDIFDFYALKHRLGKRGKAAIADMRTWKDHPQFSLIEEKIESASSSRHPSRSLINITVIGEKPAEYEKLKSTFRPWRCNAKNPCFVKQIAMNKTDKKQVMVFSFKEGAPEARLYFYDGWWQLGQTFSTIKGFSPEMPPVPRAFRENQKEKNKMSKSDQKKQMKMIIDALKQDTQKLIEPNYLDLEIGGIKLRQ